MQTNQIKVDEKWVDGEPTQDKQEYRIKIKSGNVYGYEKRIHRIAQPITSKKISMSDIGEMLPDSVLVDLEDFKTDKSSPALKRQVAARISTRINSGFMIDVFNSEFEALMTRLASNTSLTAMKANEIIAKLRS